MWCTWIVANNGVVKVHMVVFGGCVKKFLKVVSVGGKVCCKCCIRKNLKSLLLMVVVSVVVVSWSSLWRSLWIFRYLHEGGKAMSYSFHELVWRIQFLVCLEGNMLVFFSWFSIYFSFEIWKVWRLVVLICGNVFFFQINNRFWGSVRSYEDVERKVAGLFFYKVV